MLTDDIFFLKIISRLAANNTNCRLQDKCHTTAGKSATLRKDSYRFYKPFSYHGATHLGSNISQQAYFVLIDAKKVYM